MPPNVPIPLWLQPICQALINGLRVHTGAVSGLLHPQRRHRPGAPAHRQHLHEPAQAPGVLRPAPDEEQAAVRHRVLGRVRAKLRRAKASLSLHPWTPQKWLGRKTLETEKKKKRERRESKWCTDLPDLLCLCVYECVRAKPWVRKWSPTDWGKGVQGWSGVGSLFLKSLLLLSNLNV